MILPQFAERLRSFISPLKFKCPCACVGACLKKMPLGARLACAGHAVSAFLGHIFDHRGRASRKEYLIFWAAQTILSILIYSPLAWWFFHYPENFINPYTGDFDSSAAAAHMQTLSFAWKMALCLWLLIVSHLALIFAWCTTTARRLRDIGWTPWWMVAGFIPGIAVILWFTLVIYPSRPAEIPAKPTAEEAPHE